ncbi:MAG: ABC transporter substrate-binding protein [Candidatus Marinimicrobia bacterium]|nr:ABC transporter substrate-binding protein [Candidatus Neomarinimicrobiota bacterium]
MRKVLLILLISFLTIALLTFGKVTITIWTFFGGGEGYIMTNLIKQFNQEHPDIEVQEQIVEWGQYYNKLLTAIVAGEPPDIGVMHLSVLPDYAERGALTPLNEFFPKSFLEDFVPEVINKAYFDGKLYAIPIDTHPMVLYYNKTVLKKAGLVDANGNVLIPKTWDELLEYAKKAKEKLGLNVGLTFETGPMLGERLFIAVYTQLGGKFYDPKTKTIHLDVEKAEKTYKILKRFFDEKVSQVIDYATGESLFQNDKTAYHINGVWAMAVYPTVEGLDFGVTSIPALPGSKPYTWADSHTWVIPKKPKMDEEKVKAAATFIKWFIEHTYEWAKAGHLPVLRSVLKSEEFLNLPMRKDYVDVINYVVPAPSMRGWTEMRQKMWDLGQAVILEDITPADAAKELLSTIKEILEE